MVETARVERHGGIPWMMTIYQTQALTDNNARIPERVVARQISASLDELGIDHEIAYDFPAVSVSTQQAVCPAATSVAAPSDGELISDPPLHDNPVSVSEHVLPEFDDYLATDAPRVGADSNLILTNARGGGCAATGGNVAGAGAKNLDEDPGQRIIRGVFEWGGLWGEMLNAAMHEVTHNAGFGHGRLSCGMGFRTGPFEYEMTPNGGPGSSTGENDCGETVPERTEDDTTIRLFYYHTCFAENADIVDKPPLGDTSRPVADPNGPYVVNSNGTVNLDASGSFHESRLGEITSTSWTVINGPGEVLPATFDQPATYTPGNVDTTTTATLELQVVDSWGQTDTATVEVAIEVEADPPPGPECSADADCPEGEVCNDGTCQPEDVEAGFGRTELAIIAGSGLALAYLRSRSQN